MNTLVSSFTRVIPRRYYELVVYFIGAAFIGHYLEYIWLPLRYSWSGLDFVVRQLATVIPLPLSEPYGFGVVAVVLFVVPLMKKYQLGPVWVYALNVLVTGFVEYLCALAIVAAYGSNVFWNYSSLPFNIQGYVCLETSLLFGLVATVFVYVAYPACERALRRLDDMRLAAIAWSLVAVYGVDLIWSRRL